MNLRRKNSYLAIMPALGLAFALSAQAAGDAPDRQPMQQTQKSASDQNASTDRVKPATASAVSMPASRLIGMELTNRDDEDVGEIVDLVVDTSSGDVRYAVVSFGGFLGLGEKHFAYPLERFQPAPGDDRDKLVLNVDKERMESAPGFDRSEWPNFNDPDYRGEIDRYYGIEASESTAEKLHFVRMSKMLDGDVKDRSGDDVGDVHDAAIDMKNGKVHYVVLEFDEGWTTPDRLVAMPMQALRSEDGDRTDLVYQADRDRLERAPTFEKDRWPEIVTDSSFRNEFDKFHRSWETAQADTADASR